MQTSPTYRGWKWTYGDATGKQLAALVPTSYRVIHVASAADEATDWNVANPSHPTFYIHSETTPATDYISFSHDGTAGTITVAGGTLALNGVTSLGLQVGGTEEVTLTATALSPTTNAGNALGTTALGWNGLHLGTGTAINWVNGNVTITHSTGVLTVDGAAMVFNEASADLDFRIESNDNANMFVLDGGLNSIGIGGAAASGQTLVVTNAAAAATGRVLKVSGTYAAAALTDGYGAHEVDITLSGSPTDHSAASSSWLNITGGTVPAGTYVCARNDGIYEATAATITNAKLIFGARMHYLADDTDGLRFPFSLNTSNAAITALFDCQNISDFGTVAAAGSDATLLLPVLRDAAGSLRYARLYTN